MCSLRQLGQYVKQVRVWLDVARAACKHETVDDGAGFCSGDRVAEEPNLSAGGYCPFILPISGRKSKFIIAGIRYIGVASKSEM